MNLTLTHIIDDLKEESSRTLKLLNALTDAALAYKVYDGGRTLGYLAWHIPLSQAEMGTKSGLNIEGPAEDAPAPETAAEIAETYKQVSDALINALGSQWTDDTLEQEVEMYGQKWTNIKVLTALVRHEIHHRAQLTILMRQAGLKVPGLYGPAKEEWAQFGMPEMP